jgi:hypothetical protein
MSRAGERAIESQIVAGVAPQARRFPEPLQPPGLRPEAESDCHFRHF